MANINKQLTLQKKVHELSQIILKFYPTSIMLITLLAMNYKIVMLKSQIPQILLDRIMYLKRKKKRELFSNKMSKDYKEKIEKMMFEPNCCTFESYISKEKMGTIYHASKNVEAIFGFKPKNIEGSNINRIMPHSMRDEHDRILANWVASGHWTNVGVVRHIFALSKNESCFSLAIYLKIIQRAETINIIAACFRDNDKDYMIINDRGYIDGAGSKFVNILGPKIVGLPFSFIAAECMEGIRQDLKKTVNDKKINMFFSVREFDEEIELYTQ